jgi:hypothetical protein
MYDTFIHDVKAHIDSKTAVQDAIHVKGWAFSEAMGVCPVRCKYDGTVRGVDIDTRQDVCDRFKRNNLILSGWKISLPPNKYVDLQIKLGAEWTTFLSFHSVASVTSDFAHNLESALQNVEVSTTKSNVENPTNEVVIPPYGANLENVVQHFLEDFIKRNPHVNPATTTVNVINVASNNTTQSDLYVLNNFYENPDDIRKVALSTLGQPNTSNFVKEVPMFKKQFEKIMNVSLSPFTKYEMNGTFSYTTSRDSAQLEKKTHQYEGIVFLTPDAPVSSGITFYRPASSSWENKKLEETTDLVAVDSVGNVFNRLVIFNTKKIHACPHMFGGDKTDGRLIQTFAFDLE